MCKTSRFSSKTSLLSIIFHIWIALPPILPRPIHRVEKFLKAATVILVGGMEVTLHEEEFVTAPKSGVLQLPSGTVKELQEALAGVVELFSSPQLSGNGPSGEL